MRPIKAMQSSYRQVDATGFQEMPTEMYKQWLKSIEQAKKQEAFRQEQEKCNEKWICLKNETNFNNQTQRIN